MRKPAIATEAIGGELGPKAVEQRVVITPPNMRIAKFRIVGTSPLVINAFDKKAEEAMRAAQEAGGQRKGKKIRPAKDFDALFRAATYRSEEGWCGINAAAFRNAMIGACRLVEYKMTLGKLSLFVLADGRDERGTDLVRIIGDEPTMDVRPARNANGSFDLRARPMWKDWQADVRVRWDLDQFSLADVTNLLSRVGMQCGIGEGRASSKMSAGIGWGMFEVQS
jgi:hypothetical protein